MEQIYPPARTSAAISSTIAPQPGHFVHPGTFRAQIYPARIRPTPTHTGSNPPELGLSPITFRTTFKSCSRLNGIGKISRAPIS